VAERHGAGASGLETARSFADDVAHLLAERFDAVAAHHSLPGAALLALGGFGRRELSPCSDVDVMLLVPDGRPEDAREFAGMLFTPLWDDGFEPGTAVRTLDETLLAADSDHTIRTALQDALLVAGDGEAAGRLSAALRRSLAGRTLETFVAAKVEEIRARRERAGGTVLLREPDVKVGVGGLRDLAGALWVAGARHGIPGWQAVVHMGLLPRAELAALGAAHDTLLRLRCQLHLQAGRREDRLSWIAQEQAARALLPMRGDAPDVPSLMRGYYDAARTVERACDALLERCEHPVRPNRHGARPSEIDGDFELREGRLGFSARARPEHDAALLVRLFATAEREGAAVYGAARETVVREVRRRGASLASDRPAHAAFLACLESPGSVGEAAAGMFDAGLLEAMFPELGRVRALAQNDPWHAYTVDAHTLLAVRKLLRLRAGVLAADEPVFTRLAQDLPRPLPLYVGMLFHDLGKGAGAGHAARSEKLLAEWADRVGLDAGTAEDARFLVREHLRLSATAYRRDLADPVLVRDTAALTCTRERLDMLYLLTYADVSSVGPDAWTDWRARLLRELYAKCRAILDAAQGVPELGLGRAAPADHTEAARAGERALRDQLVARADPHEQGDPVHARDVERFLAALPERYLATVSPTRARLHFDVWRRARWRAAAGPLSLAGASAPHPEAKGAGDLVVAADDRPGLLAMLTGALAAHSVDILAAEIFSLRDGTVLDSFLVREPGGVPPSAERTAAALADLERLLKGEESAPALLARRRGGARFAPAPGPPVPTRVAFDLEAAREATVVDVYTRDRIGLLHDIAEALHDAGASIVLARVATEGNRAADGFYIQDFSGKKITDPGALERVEQELRERLRE